MVLEISIDLAVAVGHIIVVLAQGIDLFSTGRLVVGALKLPN